MRTPLADFFSSLLEDFSIVPGMHPRLVGKTERGTIRIAGVVEIDSIVPADRFHGYFKGNGLGIEVARCVGAAGQDADHVRLRVLGIGHHVDVGDCMVSQFVARRSGRKELSQCTGEPVLSKPLQESGNLAVGRFRGNGETDSIHVRDGGVDLEEHGRGFGIFDTRTGWSFRPGDLFVLRAGHDEKHKKPEPDEHAENHDEGVDSGPFSFFIGMRLFTHDGLFL